MEAVETQRDELEKHYDGIPACVRSKNEAEWNAVLEEILMKIALQPDEKSPEHTVPDHEGIQTENN